RIYVAGEIPVTFAAVAARDEFLLPIFMNQTAETIEQARNHPSIILWTLANETTYGFNIGKMAEYVFNEDPSLPVLFSWSQTVPEDVPLPYNIYSYHYPDYDDDLAERGVSVFNNPGTEREIPPMPVLADEFAHPASYNYEEMRLDPNVRNFWGETIKIFWERMATTHGSLGGAIFAGIDHPRTLTAEFPWGLLDKWRRAKPEYWLTKKAYSPVRVEKEQVYLDDTEALAVPVKNWFDHTNLNETTFTWSVGESTETTQGPDVPPHGAGNILIPFNGLQPGDIINLKINLSRDNRLIDEYNIPVDPEPHSLPSPEGPAPEVSEDAQSIVIAGEDFQITFNKQSGLIASGSYNGVELIKDGPYLHIIGADLSDWKHTGLSTSVEGNETVVTIDGTYQARPEIPRGFGEDDGAREPVTVETTFEVRIDGQGLINTRYQIHQFPLKAPETRLVPWNRTNAGGYEEVGIRFLLDDSIHSLSWKRNGLWSAYPEDHIGRNEGVAPRTTENEKQVGIEPGWPWSLDEKDFNLFGPDDPGNRGTNDFRSMKENIYEATALTPVGVGVKVLSDGAESVRLELAGTDTATGVWMHINNEWNYRHLGLGNYMKPPILIEDGYSDNIYTRFVGR
ncbi:MAG: glycoside hydrolase family 2 TIM barrel-domain containing protein, partial [Balneolaceae bacterium]